MEMNEATMRSLAAVKVQRQWRRKRLAFNMADVVQSAILQKKSDDAKSSDEPRAADESKAAEGEQGAAEKPAAGAGDVDPDEPPPGLTKMQQVAWKRQQRAKQKEKGKEGGNGDGD